MRSSQRFVRVQRQCCSEERGWELGERLYNKPVWITEFCPVDWDHKGRVTPQSAVDFIKIVLPELNRRSYVQRYAWFTSDTDDKDYGPSALFNKDGSLTIVGKAYAEQPAGVMTAP